jgi:hypothetical protein
MTGKEPPPRPEVREFEYSGEIREGESKTFLLYVEKEPG